jgi:hypothetical protein
MAFGPESNNPRELRSYAHTKIYKLAIGEANYGEALQAVYKAIRTAKGKTSGFEGALSNAADKVVQWEQGRSSHRGIRRVPLNWEHPKDKNGHFIPLFDTREPAGGKYTVSELEEMIEKGDISRYEDLKSWFMPIFKDVPDEEMGVCLYETTTEGTPLTPVFPDTEQGHKDLAAYASEYATRFAGDHMSAQDWEQRFFGQPEQVAS